MSVVVGVSSLAAAVLIQESRVLLLQAACCIALCLFSTFLFFCIMLHLVNMPNQCFAVYDNKSLMVLDEPFFIDEAKLMQVKLEIWHLRFREQIHSFWLPAG